MSSLLTSSIRLDGETQTRAVMDSEVIREYSEDMKAGAAFPPVMVFFDGLDHWLADGFHRVEAAKSAGIQELQADIRQGSRRDALLHAVGANQAHGLRRSNADKRRAVQALLEDAEWCTWSDREISRHTGTSHTFVANLRPKVATLPPPSGKMAIGTGMAGGSEWNAYIVPAAGMESGFYVALLRKVDGLVIVTKKPFPGELVSCCLEDDEIPAGMVWNWSFHPVSNESDDEEPFPLDRRWSWPHLLFNTKADWLANRWKAPHAS